MSHIVRSPSFITWLSYMLTVHAQAEHFDTLRQMKEMFNVWSFDWHCVATEIVVNF